MIAHKLIEEVANEQKELLPVMYKKLLYTIKDKQISDTQRESINFKSHTHQTPLFEGLRFYKNIEIFKI